MTKERRPGIAWKISKEDLALAITLIVLFSLLCICKLLTAGEYSGDEFFTLEDTLGFVHTGQQLEWDFNTNALSSAKARINPYFYILSLWIRLGGTAALYVRSLSVVFGLAALVSFYYIIRRLTASSEWAFLAGLLFTLNPEMLTVSTIARGYALLVLLMIWVYYFSYQALNGSCHIKFPGRVGKWCSEYLCFNYWYALSALVLLLMAYRIRVFVFIYMLGIGIYCCLRAFFTCEKKFRLLAGFFSLLIILSLASAALPMERYVPILLEIGGRLRTYASIGVRNLEYFKEIGQIFCVVPLTVLGAVMVCCYLYRQRRSLKESCTDVLIYMLSIVLVTLIAFTTFIDWAHNIRYLTAIFPAAIFVITAGFFLFIRDWEADKRWFFYTLLICCMGVNFSAMELGGSEERENFVEAYEKLAQNIEEEPVFITGIRLRGYYAREILPDYEWQPMTSKGDEPEINHLMELISIGRQHPQGIITCEDSRWYHFRNSFWQLLMTDAFERLTGGELDNTHVGNWYYQLCYPMEGRIAEEEKIITLFGNSFGGYNCITEKEGRTVVELELNGSVVEPTLLCIRINQFHDGERTQRFLQLVLEPNGKERQYYRLELEQDYTSIKSEIDSDYFIYKNGKNPEDFEDCYILE